MSRLTAKPSEPSPASTTTLKLTRVLDQSEQINSVVAQCADELSSVNSAFKQELVNAPPQVALEQALEQSEAVESKVQLCAEDLSAVNQALKAEVKERHLLEDELQASRDREALALEAALHDPLTSLPNRGLFNDRLEHGLAQAKRHGWTLAVMFIDLDGFKKINDQHGHHAGDVVLQTVASRLKAMTREDDTVSRHGGDEFLYLLMALKLETDAIAVASKIIASINEPCELSTGEGTVAVRVGCSIGIAIFPADGATDASLIATADKAMYRAKRNGGGYAFDRSE